MGIFFSRPAYVVDEPYPIIVGEAPIIYHDDVVLINDGVYYGGSKSINKIKISDLKNLSKNLNIKINKNITKKEIVKKITNKIKKLKTTKKINKSKKIIKKK